MLFGNGKAQQDTNGAEAEFKTGKHLPVPRLDVTVSARKKMFHGQNPLFFYYTMDVTIYNPFIHSVRSYGILISETK